MVSELCGLVAYVSSWFVNEPRRKTAYMLFCSATTFGFRMASHLVKPTVNGGRFKALIGG